MTNTAVDQKEITRVAADYVARACAGDMTAAEEQKLFDWLAQSPDHEAEYRQLLAVWGRLGDLGEQSHVVSRIGSSRTWGRRTLTRIVLATAASVLLVIGGMSLLDSQRPALQPAKPFVVYTTAVGEQNSIRLPDGSIVHLNTDSMVQVRDSQQAREVIFDKGEAFFDVHKSTRPFIVQMGAERLTVLGTKFNVFQQDAGLTVAVVEGAVALQTENLPESYRVSAGSMAQIEQKENPGQTSRIVTKKLEIGEGYRPWHQGRVSFNKVPLQDVVSEIARYTSKQVSIADQDIENLSISAVLHVNDVEQALAALETIFPIQVNASDDSIVIGRR